ncbi:uncharacterized protein LOC135840373 isoform X1 [Planococcus citri]|uniref:uncharacterized protein LOC135840373 isoform X1 n=1 Tax=Planococcus citri TaxID=170843 RepID=UPI0031F905CB
MSTFLCSLNFRRMPYVVIQYINSDKEGRSEVVAVPENWIKENKLWCPLSTYVHTWRKSIEKQVDPKENWKSFDIVKTWKTTESLEEANKIADDLIAGEEEVSETSLIVPVQPNVERIHHPEHSYEAVLKELKKQRKFLEAIYHEVKKDKSSARGTTDIDEIIKTLPFKTVTNFIETESKLNEDEKFCNTMVRKYVGLFLRVRLICSDKFYFITFIYMSALVKIFQIDLLRNFGGTTKEDFVRNILKACFSGDVCRGVNFTGKNDKVQLKETRFYSLMLVVAMEKYSSNDISGVVMEWMRTKAYNSKRIPKKKINPTTPKKQPTPKRNPTPKSKQRNATPQKGKTPSKAHARHHSTKLKRLQSFRSRMAANISNSADVTVPDEVPESSSSAQSTS